MGNGGVEKGLVDVWSWPANTFVYRFHFSDGVGLPVARHLSVTLVPSLATTSVDVSESSMFGGTKLATNKKRAFMSVEHDRAREKWQRGKICAAVTWQRHRNLS